MARPTETGLSYFPLDIDFDYDDKFQMISAKYKAEGCWIVIIVLSKIYDDLGYYYQWSEKEQLLTSRRVNSDLTTVINVIKDAINYGIFDKDKYERFGILTSKGIQKRYFEATKKRKFLSVFAEYLINPEIISINSEITLINMELNTQIKEKETILKKKEKKELFSDISFEIILSKQLYESILKNNPDHKKPSFQLWAKEVSLMMNSDKRTKEQISDMIAFSTKHQFWLKNILSMQSLRKHFDRLLIEKNKGNDNGKSTGAQPNELAEIVARRFRREQGEQST
jgi:hypothetical protein